MKNLVVFCFVLISQSFFSQNCHWVKRNYGEESTHRNCIQVVGNYIYTAGLFSGYCNIGTTSAPYILPNTGSGVYVTKANLDGSIVGFTYFSGDNFGPLSLAIDNDGNIFIGGDCWGSMELDTGSGLTQHSTGYSTNSFSFIMKLDNNLSTLWQKAIGKLAYPPQDYLHFQLKDLVTDNEGAIIATGYFTTHAGYSVDMNPNSGVDIIQAADYDENAFVMKLDSVGGYDWSHVISTYYPVSFESVTCDINNNIYACGINEYLGFKQFLVKLNAGGDIMWDANNIDIGNSYSTQVELVNNNIWWAGYFSNSCEIATPFDTMSSTGFSTTGNIVVLDTAGHINDIKCFNSQYTPLIKQVALDTIYILMYTDSLTLNFGAGPFIVNSNDGGLTKDLILLKMDKYGNYIDQINWYDPLGGLDVKYIDADSHGEVYLAGHFGMSNDLYFTSTDSLYNFTTNQYWEGATIKYDFSPNYYNYHASIFKPTSTRNFTIYPNPTDKPSNLFFTGLDDGDYSLEIVNSLGERLMFIKSFNKEMHPLNGVELSHGVYYLNIYDESYSNLVGSSILIIQ